MKNGRYSYAKTCANLKDSVQIFGCLFQQNIEVNINFSRATDKKKLAATTVNNRKNM